ncbi:MAG: hypothetical protein Q7J37_01530 [Candidatus Omnitrophota bacterium]|nr:hypothetical protein [Candidatus Omnitrophota bacterium]
MKRKFPKILYFLVCFLLIFEQSGFAQVAGQLDISRYFSGLSSSLSLDKFRPLHLRYLSYDNLNNSFNLLLDKGDSKDLKETNLKDSTKELMNYFFTGIALPNDSFWVNLRPDSPDNIIDPYLAQTDLGKILLEADLQLKKDTASFTSPQTREGKQYWDKLYKKAGKLFGSENITIPTLTRPWIVPGEIIIRESTDNAYIYKATLKVMLEQDYLKGSAVYNFQDERLKQLNEYSSQLIRATIIPKLTKDVNTAKRYAPLRQAYYSLILAQWFKQKFYGKGGFYSSLINRNNLTGLTSKEAWSKTTYFQAYQKSFKEGEYNIKEQVYALGSPTIRSYMSGGIAWQDISKVSFPIVGTEKRNPFNSKLGKFIIAAFVAGAIIFPSSNNAAGAASFDTAANTAQISAPAASANLELQRVPIPIVAKNAPATGVSGLGEIGTDLASVRTILNDLAEAGIKHIEPRLLLKYINIANDVNTRDKIGKAYNLLRTKGVYSGPMYRVLFVQDLNNQVIVLAKSGVVVLDLFLLSEQSQIKELPVLLSAGASFLSDKSPLLERHLNAQKKKMAAMTVLGIPPRYQTGINKAFEAIYTRAGSLAKELAIDNKEQFLNNTIIMNIAVKEMDLTRLKQNNRLRVILKIWHPFARKYFEYPVFIHPNGSVEGGKIEERKEDLSPAGWVPVLSESKENIIYSLPVALPASSSPVQTVFSGEEIVGDLLYLENVAKETLSESGEDFKEKVFLLFGTKLGERYDIKRIIPVSKYLKQTQDYVESDPVHIAELIDKYAAGEFKLLGVLHTHPYDVIKIITKPGPSWQDRLGEDFLLPERSEKIIDIPLGVVIEAAVPKDISLEGLQDVVPDINAYFYLPEEKAGIKTIDVFKVINFKEWIDQKGNNLVVVSSAIKRPRVEPKEDIGVISINNGDKLSMRKGQEENIVSVAFYNKDGEQIGFVDILLRESLLNYIYINPDFRSENYAKVILDAILDKLQDQSFTGRQFTFVTTYVQNPLIVNYLLGKGFILNPYPMPTEQSLMTKATLSKSRQIEGKISLFIEDETKRDAFKNTLGNEGFEIVDKPIEGETYTVMINAKYTLYFEEKSGETQANSASPVYNEEQKTGGIDFRALPIASQPVLINQKVNVSIIPLIPLAELNSEWLRIENMLASGITPSSERIKEYLQSCSQKQDFNQDIDKVLSCIADIFRFEEERVADTDASLKAMLMLLESDKPVAQMQLALAQITVEAKEPKIIE